MASLGHLWILGEAFNKGSIDIWNQWRLDNPSVEPDLSSTSLSGKDLTGIRKAFVKLILVIQI